MLGLSRLSFIVAFYNFYENETEKETKQEKKETAKQVRNRIQALKHDERTLKYEKQAP